MIIINLDSTKKNRHIIRPSEQFDGGYHALVQHLTCSNDDVKNYHSFEVIE